MSNWQHRRRHQRAHDDQRFPPGLLTGVRHALRDDHPLGLLMMASQVVEISTARPLDRFSGRSPTMDRDQIIRSLQETDRPESTALLVALAVLVPADRTQTEIGAELDRGKHHLPAWVTELDQASITGAVEFTDVFGDGDDVMVGLRWPSGRAITAVVYIDHNLGTVVKDAFVVPEGLDQVRSQFAETADPASRFEDLDRSEARARIVDAVDKGEHTLPPLESVTWPGCRAIVEWVASLLPQGGTGYVFPEWSDRQLDELRDRFLASSFATGLSADAGLGNLVDDLLFFASSYGPGDPLRWSPVSVEIVLADWFPRKIVAPVAHLRRLPDVLRGFIRFAHAERGIPPARTAETLQAVRVWEPEFEAAIDDTPRARGATATVEASRAYLGFDDHTHYEYTLEVLANEVGGPEQLNRLDDTPIHDEAFDWTGIPDDILDRVGEVLRLTDQCCDEVLDVEFRTIVRRLLARAAAGDPAVFRRKARSDRAAAALVWVTGRASGLFRWMTVQSLLEWFGLSGSVSQRARTLLVAAGVRAADDWYPTPPASAIPTCSTPPSAGGSSSCEIATDRREQIRRGPWLRGPGCPAFGSSIRHVSWWSV